MANRRWTVLVVPHGSEPPKSVQLSERALRGTGTAATTVAFAALLWIGAADRLGLREPPRMDADMARLLTEASELRMGLDMLRDTLAALSSRDRQLRLAAGLPSGDSASAALPGGPNRDVGGLLREARLLSANFDQVQSAISRNADRMANTPSIMPTAGWLTSAFSKSRFHPILHVSRPHDGIDVVAPMGAPIVAPAAGTVTKVAEESGYGLVLVIDHGGGIETKYAHCSRIGVRVGQRVVRGEAVAAVGSSGLATGPHLHYEIHVRGKVVDPLKFVLPGAIPD